MTEQEIQRINELYHKSKETGLTKEEADEQADSIHVQEADGTITRLKEVGEKNRRPKDAVSETGGEYK